MPTWNRHGIYTAALATLVAITPRGSSGSAGLFEAFPRVDDRQLAVYEADVLQFVGTASTDAVLSVLRSARDHRFQPLLVTKEGDAAATGVVKRVLMSVGIADFRNTSSGPYRELVVAFPACERDKPPEPECRNFISCQSQLPDCVHTYMFRSFVSQEGALWTARSFGVDAQLATKFDFERKNDTIKFSVLGPGGSEVLAGSVHVGVPGTAGADHDLRNGTALQEPPSQGNQAQKLSRDGYNLHPYIGIPGVLGPGQARYICAFSAKVSVKSVQVLGNLQGGPLLEDLDFRPEGVMHLPDVSVMQMPPFGHGGAPGSPPPSLSQTTRKAPSRPAEEQDDRIGPGLRSFFGLGGGSGADSSSDVEMVEGGDPPRAPWVKGASSAGSKPFGSEDLPWDFHKASSSTHTRPGAVRRTQDSRPAARGMGASRGSGLSALLSEL